MAHCNYQSLKFVFDEEAVFASTGSKNGITRYHCYETFQQYCARRSVSINLYIREVICCRNKLESFTDRIGDVIFNLAILIQGEGLNIEGPDFWKQQTMALMIPDFLPECVRSDGEERLFSKLQQSKDTDGWLVFHSLKLGKHISRIEGEIDMVIVVPHEGVLCVEVKASRKASREGRLWNLGNTLTRDPFQQADSATRTLRDMISGSSSEFRNVLFTYAVFFTHTVPIMESDQVPVEWRTWQLIDAIQFETSEISSLILSILRKEHTYIKTRASGGWLEKNSPTTKQVKLLKRILSGNIAFEESARARAVRRKQQIHELTKSQKFALNGVRGNPRVIFQGAAGTGKTYLAVEAAKLSAAEGKRVLFLCFNHRLGAELKVMTGEIANITVDTIYTHMCTLLNISPYLCEQKSEDGEFWKSIPEQALSVLLEGSELCGNFDYLVLDEAQDLLIEEFLDYLDLLLKGGLREGKWLFTGDFERQNIYNRDSSPVAEFLSSRIKTNFFTFSLFDNLRNQKLIACLAERCLQQSCYAEIKRNTESDTPAVFYYRTREEQQKHLQDSVRGLFAKGFVPEEIAILSYRKNPHSAVSDMTEDELGMTPADFRDSLLQDRVLAGSIHGFKGCERPAVIVTDIDDLSSEWKRGLLYLGASRAQDSLILIARSSERKRLNAILSKET